MIRGTTPTHTFELNVDTSAIEAIYITYSQCKKVVFEKTKDDCTFEDDGKSVTVRLTQEDTLKLSSSYTCKVQIRAKLTSYETAIASDTFVVSIDDVLKDGVI